MGGTGREMCHRLSTDWLHRTHRIPLQGTVTQLMHAINVMWYLQPMYGGKRHRVTADVRRVKEKKPILKLEGEWNGVLYTKLPNKVTFFYSSRILFIIIYPRI